MINLIFLGTGAGQPSMQRNVSGIALNLTDEKQGIWLFDCGEATQHQMMRCGLNPQKIEKIFITHMHGDHVFGLPGLLTSRSMSQNAQPLSVYGPPGIKAFIESSLQLSHSFLTYPVDISEIVSGTIFRNEIFEVIAAPMAHRITCFGYRIKQADLPGALNMEKLRLANVPSGPLLKRIKNGESVRLDDGRIVNGCEYMGDPVRGKVVVILGDTAPSSDIVQLAMNADVLVHEATLEAALEEKANSRGHSTTVQAAQTACDARVKKLIVTHISARYKKSDEPQFLQECRNIFPNTKIARDFEIFSVE